MMEDVRIKIFFQVMKPFFHAVMTLIPSDKKHCGINLQYGRVNIQIFIETEQHSFICLL